MRPRRWSEPGSRAAVLHRTALCGGVVVATVSFVASQAVAHDYWLVPSELVVANDRAVAVSLFVGEGFVADEEKRFERSRVTRLAHLHRGSSDDLLDSAVDGELPMLRLRLRGAGAHLLIADRSASRIELEPHKFEEYLRHEDLTTILEERARLGESGKPGRERYTRYLKTLIQVGGVRDEIFGSPIGQTLELVPESHPVFAEPGSKLVVGVRFKGVPLPGARVDAFSRNGANIRGSIYTSDADGRIQIAIDRRGAWLLRLVHMVRCDGCPDADWESFWASYTFASAESSGATVAAPSMLESESLMSKWALRLTIIAIAPVVATSVAIYLSRRRRQSQPTVPRQGGQP